MAQQNKPQNDSNKDIDVSRSEHQQAQKVANNTGNEERQEGSKDKGNPEHHHSSHAEGQYTKQSDDPTMNPSNIDEES